LECACTWLPVNPEALVEAISNAQLDLPEKVRKALGIAQLKAPSPAPPTDPPAPWAESPS
jgi:hypothetical protein